jgi:DNA adenine methylase
MGSKNRHAKHILPFIYKAIEEINATAYVEPFVGGANMIDKVDVKIPKIGNDFNYHLIEMFKALQNGWLPPEDISEEEYHFIKENKEDLEPALVAYTGFSLSYGAVWFSTYRKDSIGTRNYSLESYRAIVKQSEKIKDIQFKHGSYIDLHIPDNSVIYADPPYRNTASYKGVGESFNHDEFWEWAEIMVELGHKVFVSEYTAPENWKCIWSKEVTSSLTQDTGAKKAVEKLFTL